MLFKPHGMIFGFSDHSGKSIGGQSQCYSNFYVCVIMWGAVAQRQYAGLSIEISRVRILFTTFSKLEHFRSLVSHSSLYRSVSTVRRQML